VSSGHIDRHDFTWKMLHHNEKRPRHRYVVMRGGQAEGYLAFWQSERGEPLVVADVCAITPEAGRRIWSLLADHRSMVETVKWSGARNDSLMLLLPEQKHTVDWALDLMLRLVDVPAALAARGYPLGANAALHLDVRDDLLPWNNGRFVLEIADGRGEVRAGGESRVRVDIRGLAALYSGYLTPCELRMAGALEGPEEDLIAAGLAFAGPRPWTPDMF
jgi:predicted acetyltransferase